MSRSEAIRVLNGDIAEETRKRPRSKRRPYGGLAIEDLFRIHREFRDSATRTFGAALRLDPREVRRIMRWTGLSNKIRLRLTGNRARDKKGEQSRAKQHWDQAVRLQEKEDLENFSLFLKNAETTDPNLHEQDSWVIKRIPGSWKTINLWLKERRAGVFVRDIWRKIPKGIKALLREHWQTAKSGTRQSRI